MKKPFLLSIATVCICIAIGCSGKAISGGGTPPPTPNPTPTVLKAKLGFHVGPGQAGAGSISVNRTTASASLPYPFRLMAVWMWFQSSGSTPTITMSFSGFCSNIDNPVGTELQVLGLGTLNANGCGMSSSDEGVPAPTRGAPVVGAGTLSELHIYAEPIATGSVLAKVYVNGVLTPLTCSFGTVSKCADTTHTVAVNDGDMVAVTLTADSASAASDSRNIRVMLGKQ